MQLLPAFGLLDDGMILSLRHTLCRLLPSGTLKVCNFGLGVDYLRPSVVDVLYLLIDAITGTLVTGSILFVFDFCNEPMVVSNIKAFVRL